jgi:hypothetical protein
MSVLHGCCLAICRMCRWSTGPMLFGCDLTASAYLSNPLTDAMRADGPDDLYLCCAAQSIDNAVDGCWQIVANLEVPDPQNCPSVDAKLFVYAAISCNVLLDLSIPIRAGTTGLMSRWMAVPKSSVYEYGNSASRPGDIGTARGASVVAAPPPDAVGIECLSQRNLRAGIPAPYGGHNALPLLWCPSIRHRVIMRSRPRACSA